MGATTLWDPWDASRPALEITGTPSVFGRLQLLQLAVVFRSALWEAGSASTDLSAGFKVEGKKSSEGNG